MAGTGPIAIRIGRSAAFSAFVMARLVRATYTRTVPRQVAGTSRSMTMTGRRPAKLFLSLPVILIAMRTSPAMTVRHAWQDDKDRPLDTPEASSATAPRRQVSLRTRNPTFRYAAYRHHARYGSISAAAVLCIGRNARIVRPIRTSIGHHHGQRQGRAVQAEERRRPQRVRRQLPTPQPQHPLRADAPPDQPPRGADHHVKSGPDRGEHPVRRSPRRLRQGRVPARHRMRRHRSADDTHQQAQPDKSHQREHG